MSFQFSAKCCERWGRLDIIRWTVPESWAGNGKWAITDSDTSWWADLKKTGSIVIMSLFLGYRCLWGLLPFSPCDVMMWCTAHHYWRVSVRLSQHCQSKYWLNNKQDIYSSFTSISTWQWCYRPPNAVPFHVLPVTSWNGRVEISWPAPATPMITDVPQPLWHASSAARCFNQSINQSINRSIDRSTITSLKVTTYVNKPSAMGQPTRPTQPLIPSGSID